MFKLIENVPIGKMDYNHFSLSETNKRKAECRARSDCTYVQADVALHWPQIGFMVQNDTVGVEYIISKSNIQLFSSSLINLKYSGLKIGVLIVSSRIFPLY